MCIGAGVAAAIGAVTSVISTGAGIVGMMQQQQQAQAQAQYQQQMANVERQRADVAAINQRNQVQLERQAQIRDHQTKVRAQQRDQLSYFEQLRNNNRQANKAYVQEQVKLDEAKTKASFAAQANYIKSIQAQGSVLATGSTGQSIGLMALDAERQQGFADAQQNASIRSAEQQAAVGMELAESQAISANNQAYSQLSLPVAAPQLAADPIGDYQTFDGSTLPALGIPAYNWG